MSWTVKKMPGFRISHPYIAVTPGCPTAQHPTRWCKCKVFRTNAAATEYVKEQDTK
ncbi:hypothetical protein [Glutamicibacter ardleyensis]|uniref:hypothetical protein n=1 Tax=Glutamicibacter ardleyensis TaxID=225894 RepID=UPI003FD363E7